jgi:hypothetical protein
MKTTAPEDVAWVIANMVDMGFDDAAIKYYLEASPNPSHFRNLFAAARFQVYATAYVASTGQGPVGWTEGAARFDAARYALEIRQCEFESYFTCLERWGEQVAGFEWRTQKHRAALAAVDVIKYVRDLAQAHGALRYDPMAKKK